MVLKKHYHLKDGEQLHIIPVSDAHIGSEQFNSEYFDYALHVFDDITAPKRIYSVGDLWESASLKVGNSAFKSDMTLDEQVDYSLSCLLPFHKDFRFAIKGNHESRLEKDYDFSVTKLFADRMGCECGYQFIDEFTINKQPFKIYLRHGKGSSSYAHLAQGKTIRETQQVDADLFIEGHNHRLDFFNQPIKTSTGLKRKYYAFSGAYLKYKGYPEAMLLPVLPEAFQIITIDSDLIVRSEPYFIDQRRPDLFKL